MIEELSRAAAVGSEWVLWLLIALSGISISVMAERVVFYRRRRLALVPLSQQLELRLRSGDMDSVRALLRESPALETTVLLRTLEWFDDGPESMKEVLDSALREQRLILDKGSVFLGTVGNNAPFVGLLGTVLGVVQAFRELGASTSSSMDSVMGGIAEALIATAVGLVVALPAVVAFNIFGKRANDVEDNARALMNLILAQCQSTRRRAVPIRAQAQVAE